MYDRCIILYGVRNVYELCTITNINVHRSNGNVVLEKNAQSIVDRKENQFLNSKYSKQYTKAYKQRQEKTSSISRPCDEKGKARALIVDNRRDRRKKKQRSSKNKNTRRYSSLAGNKHCGDVCGCKRSRKWKVMIAYACNRHGH